MATNKLRPFNRLEVLSSDLDFLQDIKEQDTRSRLVDVLRQPGLLTPTIATVTDIENELPTVLPIFDATAGNIHVGTSTITPMPGVYPNPTIHIAYDALGNRIEIPADDATPFNTNAPTFTTTGITGSTPYSTGRLTVPGRTPVSGTEDRYVFISHVPVVRTKSTFDPTPLPPNHQTSSGTVVTAANNKNKPVTGIDQKLGQAHADHIINGYRIYVAIGAGSTLGSSEITFDPDGTPRLIAGLFTASEPDSVNAIYIGRFTITSTNVIAVVALPDSLRPRDLMQFRSLEAAPLDTGNPTTAYTNGQAVSLQQHTNAFGTGSTLSESNPHRQSIFDLDNVNAITGQAVQPIGDTLSDGIIDKGQARNNPVTSTTVQPTLVTTGSVTYTNNTTVATVSGGIQGTTVISAGTVITKRAQFVTTLPASPINAVYINGVRITKLRQLDPSDSTKAIIPFIGTGQPTTIDATGTYTVFIANPSTATRTALGMAVNEGLIGKTTEDITGVDGVLAIAKVYWNSTSEVLQYSYIDGTAVNGTAPTSDARTFGMVGTAQISTEALSHPTRGLMNQEVPNKNILLNPDFNNTVAGVTGSDANSDSNNVVTTVGGFQVGLANMDGRYQWAITNTSGSMTATAITGSTDTTMRDTGPKINYGVELAFTPVGPLNPGTLNVKYRGHVAPLKPNTKYTMSAWMRVLNSGNKLNVAARLTNSTGSTSLSEIKNLELPLSSGVRDTTWNRIVHTFTTTSAPNPQSDTTSNLFEFNFINSTGAVFSAGSDYGNIRLANIDIFEGEWLLGPMEAYPITVHDRTRSASVGVTANTGLDIITSSVVSRGQVAIVCGRASFNSSVTSGFNSALFYPNLNVTGGIFTNAILDHHRLSWSTTSGTIDLCIPDTVMWVGHLPPGTYTFKLSIFVDPSSNTITVQTGPAAHTRPSLSVVLI